MCWKTSFCISWQSADNRGTKSKPSTYYLDCEPRGTAKAGLNSLQCTMVQWCAYYNYSTLGKRVLAKETRVCLWHRVLKVNVRRHRLFEDVPPNIGSAQYKRRHTRSHTLVGKLCRFRSVQAVIAIVSQAPGRQERTCPPRIIHVPECRENASGAATATNLSSLGTTNSCLARWSLMWCRATCEPFRFSYSEKSRVWRTSRKNIWVGPTEEPLTCVEAVTEI